MKRAVAFLGVLLAVVGCGRESRKSAPKYMETLATSAMPTPGTPGPYDGNAWAMGEGARLYNQMNCVGCHFHGGGGMGPPLMDGKWLYGADDANIFASIALGRPNGMPAFRKRLTDDQIWQLVSYVRSLSGRASVQAASVRDDHMSVTPGPARMPTQPITKQEP